MRPLILNLILVTALILVVGLAGTFSMLIYRTLNEKGETAMTKMRLQADKTYLEFRILFYSHILVTAGLLTLGIGAAKGIALAVQIGRLATIIHGIITVPIIYRWWKRFN